jgi:hypothetical protein
MQINLPSSKTAYANISTKTGYWAVDIYVPENSDAVMTFQTTNWPGATLKKGAWNTIYVKGNNTMKITDTTGGTYMVDNLRSVTEKQYLEGCYCFEMNTAGLRDNTEGDSNVFYVYCGPDHVVNRYSFAATGGGGAEITAPHFDNEITHGGTQSLAFTKSNGPMTIQMRADNNIYSVLKDGFTFWMYTTVAINGVDTANFTNGNGQKFNGGAGMMIPANTWVQITVTAEDIQHSTGEGACAFLKLNGSTAGTIYLDDFRPL